MKKWMVSAALATVAAIAPVAMAHDTSTSGEAPKGAKVEKTYTHGGDHAGRRRMVAYEFRAIVTADATAGAVSVKFVRGNRHIRRALGDAEMFSVKIDAKTKVKVRGQRGLGSYVDLKAGDKVTIEIRAKRGTKVADLPAARRIVDRGAGVVVVTPPVEEPPVVEPPVEQPPVVDPPVNEFE
jgi:hypothetical protein